ncbi:MAG: hypothetical protein KDK70_19695 [Myxococcales bacterium]|nr:hypothetical protein [Myxococcales bacterium]
MSPTIRVHVDPTIDNADLFPEWIAQRHSNLNAEFLEPGRRQWIVVEIRGTTYDYQVQVTAMHDGEPVGISTAPVDCECNSESLLQLIDRRIALALPHLEAARSAETSPRPTRPGPDPVTTLEPTTVSDPVPTRTPSNKLRTAGLATGLLGLLVVGGGVSLILAKDLEIEGRSKLYREFDPAGITVAAVGAGMVVVGATMFTSSVVRRRRMHEEYPRPRPSAIQTSRVHDHLRLSATFHRHGFGMILARSF